MIYWSRINLFVTGFSFGQFISYILGILGLIVGLKINLLGNVPAGAATIDGPLLVVACVVGVCSLVLWVVSEIIFRLRAPQEVRAFSTGTQYLATTTAGLLSSEATKETYDAIYDNHAERWSKLDQSQFGLRVFLTVIFAISLLLPLLSFALALIAVFPLLQATVLSHLG